jgi:hypothetical protein
VNPRFRAHPHASARSFGLALFAAFGVVLELFVVEKELLTRREHKLVSTVRTLKNTIEEFHGRLP